MPLNFLYFYQEIIDFPIFHQTRLPNEAPPVIEEKPIKLTTNITNQELGSYNLTGILIYSDKRYVILKDQTDGTEKQLEEGSRHNQWIIHKIRKNRVILKSNQGVRIIKLGSTN